MRARNAVFVVLSLAMAAVCTRLGVWQLQRLGERRLRNELVFARLNFPLADVSRIPADTAQSRFRRVELRGSFDAAHEFALSGRTRGGSPGVYVVTPFVRAATDTVVLVNRGWVYSPDGATITLSQWPPRSDTTTVTGFVDELPPARAGSPRSAARPRTARWIDRALLARELGRPVASFLVVVQGDTSGTGADSTPARLEPPPLDEGPHRSYAIQWFSFAAISLVGMPIFLRAQRRRGGTAPDARAP